jgi:hypothetical protein
VSFIEKLKNRWHLQSGIQVIVVLIVFACTGYSVILIKHLVGISAESPVSHRVFFYLGVLPIYNLMLLGYGFIFGQFKFFLAFEKRFFKRISGLFTKQKHDNN